MEQSTELKRRLLAGILAGDEPATRRTFSPTVAFFLGTFFGVIVTALLLANPI